MLRDMHPLIVAGTAAEVQRVVSGDTRYLINGICTTTLAPLASPRWHFILSRLSAMSCVSQFAGTDILGHR
jgi:hypothetical protein